MISHKSNLHRFVNLVVLALLAVFSQLATAAPEVGTWKDNEADVKITAKITEKFEDDPIIKCSYSTCYRDWWDALWQVNGYDCNEICSLTPRSKSVLTLDLNFYAESVTRFDAKLDFSGKVVAHKKHSNGWVEFRFPKKITAQNFKVYSSGGTYKRNDVKYFVRIWVRENKNRSDRLKFVVELETEFTSTQTKPDTYEGQIVDSYVLTK